MVEVEKIKKEIKEAIERDRLEQKKHPSMREFLDWRISGLEYALMIIESMEA